MKQKVEMMADYLVVWKVRSLVDHLVARMVDDWDGWRVAPKAEQMVVWKVASSAAPTAAPMAAH